MHFTKMQGLGNDYLYFRGEVPENVKNLSVRLSDRHFGAGSDGLIYITDSEIADFGMRIFNADGSEAKMCGNGIRCVGKYVYDKGYTDKKVLTIETLSGIKTLHLDVVEGKVKTVSVEMGEAKCEKEEYVTLADQHYRLIPVSTGNPHAVIFTDTPDDALLTKAGKAAQVHPLFPDGINIEFVTMLMDGTLRMRVWERGSGITLACGTGACASAAAAVSKGLCSHDEWIAVVLDGGILSIMVRSDGTVLMKGPAEFVFEGDAEDECC